MFSTSSTASSSVTEQPRRMFVPTWSWAKPTWPNPELSIGRELEALDGSHKCWETVGPVLELAKTILCEVRKLLEMRQDYLTERERIIKPLIYGMYMVGRRKEEANPTLLFSCAREQPRKRAKELVKESAILRDHPAIRVAHSKRPPQALRSFRVLGFTPPPRKVVNAEGVDAFGEVYCISPVNRTCGVPVFMRRKDGSFRKATIGGIVRLDDKYYGLTVAHTFVDDGFENEEGSDDDISDLECSFDSDEEFLAAGEHEQAAQFETPKRRSGGGIGRRSPREFSSFRTETLSKSSQHIDEDQASASIVGNLYKWSMSTGLDWALIEIDNSRVDPKTCNAITLTNEYGERILWPRAIVTTGSVDREVLAITGDKGVIYGHLSQGSVYMHTAQTRGFQELWTIHMRSSLEEGDCGSWVVDHENGLLYGQIVAGHPGTGVGYIIPASQIFESVWQTLGDALILPSGPPSQSNTSLPLPQAKEPPPVGSSRMSKQGSHPQSLHSPTSITPPTSPSSRIESEIDFLFSDKNLIEDRGLRKLMDSQGFVTIPALMSLARWNPLNVSPTFIRHVCEDLPSLEVVFGKDGIDYVRRRRGWAEWVLPYDQRDDSLRFPTKLAESIESHLKTAEPWKDDSGFAYSKLDDISKSMARHSLVDDKPRRGQHLYEKSKQLDAPHEDSFRYPLLKELPVREPNSGRKRRAAAVGTPSEDPNDKAIARILQRNEKDAERSETRDPSPVDPGRPVYTRMSRRYLSVETLRVHGIDYEVDTEDPDYLLLKRWVPEEEQDTLWEHTRRHRASSSDSKLDKMVSKGYRQVYPPSERPLEESHGKASIPTNGLPEDPHSYVHRVGAVLPSRLALPVGWVEYMDEASGRPYYMYSPTRAVQWEMPTFGSIPPSDQSSLSPIYDLSQQLDEPNPDESIGIIDEGIEKPDPPREGITVPLKASDLKKSRETKYKSAKSSTKRSTNAIEVSDSGSSKHKSKDSSANPLLTFLAGGRKR